MEHGIGSLIRLEPDCLNLTGPIARNSGSSQRRRGHGTIWDRLRDAAAHIT